MNYFEFYNLAVSFAIDEALLKSKYFEFSKKYHPDYHLQSSQEEQEKILELSSLNNRAYKTLSNPDSRMKYILELKGFIYEGEKYELPDEFLMEMLEVNEALMELEMNKNEEKLAELKTKINVTEKELFQAIQPLLEQYDDKKKNEQALKEIKDYYYKKKYLLRLKEGLSKIEG